MPAFYFPGEKEKAAVNEITKQVTQAVTKLQEVIESENSKLNAMVSSMTDGVIMTDTDYKILVINPAVKKAAIKIERGVNRISGIGNDDGYEWLAGWNTPIGVAYNAYWETDASDDTDFSDYLIQTVDHNTILEYGADVASWVNDAKFDIDF